MLTSLPGGHAARLLHDRNLATTYAVEAVRLIDHYRFRAVIRTPTDAKPLAS